VTVLPVLSSVVMSDAVVWQLKKWLHTDTTRDIPIVTRFTAGSAAGAIAQTAIFPMEVCRHWQLMCRA